jgi:hypothetical protein
VDQRRSFLPNAPAQPMPSVKVSFAEARPGVHQICNTQIGKVSVDVPDHRRLFAMDI